MSLLSIFKRRPELAEQGPLFAPVREAMRDVQAYARSHGGDIELLSVNGEGDVSIKLRGTCAGCPMSGITLKSGVEDRLRQLVPGVRNVIQA